MVMAVNSKLHTVRMIANYCNISEVQSVPQKRIQCLKFEQDQFTINMD